MLRSIITGMNYVIVTNIEYVSKIITYQIKTIVQLTINKNAQVSKVSRPLNWNENWEKHKITTLYSYKHKT
jgi:hypothetical protein